MHHDLRQAVRRVLPAVRADLEALVRIPSVSADPDSFDEVRRSAEMTARLFRNTGSPQVEILDDIEGGRPAVLARYAAPPGQPTAMLYAHHDVQPAGDLAGWSSPPFQPTERDGRLYGRGTADDKAGIAAHLAALRAYSGRPPIGVTVLVEGEEEVGSPNLSTFLDRHQDKLNADVIVLADADNLITGTPCLTTGLRGITSCVVELRALQRGVHSGIYGGAAPDALTALCRLLATLHDEQGNVAIEGLGTATAPADSLSETGFRAEAGLLDGVHLLGRDVYKRQTYSRSTRHQWTPRPIRSPPRPERRSGCGSRQATMQSWQDGPSPAICGTTRPGDCTSPSPKASPDNRSSSTRKARRSTPPARPTARPTTKVSSTSAPAPPSPSSPRSPTPTPTQPS